MLDKMLLLWHSQPAYTGNDNYVVYVRMFDWQAWDSVALTSFPVSHQEISEFEFGHRTHEERCILSWRTHGKR